MKKLAVKTEIFLKALKKEPDLGFVNKLLKKFPKAEIYLVGGAVRDIILKRKTKDFDFVVRKVEPKELENFLKKLGKVNLVGKSFGVFKFMPKKSKIEAIDIALPRTEHSLGLTGGYRDFKIQSNPKLPIEKDLERRDLTINAIAFDIKNKALIDPFLGLSDLAAEKIKAVGKAELRFKEDYSRMLRALRFACQFDFEIEEKTWKAIKKLIKHLNDRIIAREIIAKEMVLAFEYNRVKAFDLFDQSGAFDILMPEITAAKTVKQPKRYHAEGNVFVHTRLVLEKLNSPEFLKIIPEKTCDPEIILACLFHDIGKLQTAKVRLKKGRRMLTFHAHDYVSGKTAEKIIKCLKLESTGKIKKENVIWLIQRHMLLIQPDISTFKPSTIEKIFFNPRVPGKKLLKVILADILASLPEKRKPYTFNLEKMIKRINEMKEMDKKKKALPPRLLNGHEIMREFDLEPCILIGELLALAREAQLSKKIKTKKEALKLLRKYLDDKKINR